MSEPERTPAEARFDKATALAIDIQRRASDLSVAIVEARRWGYEAKVAIHNGVEVSEARFVGNGEHPLRVEATVSLDIGDRGL